MSLLWVVSFDEEKEGLKSNFDEKNIFLLEELHRYDIDVVLLIFSRERIKGDDEKLLKSMFSSVFEVGQSGLIGFDSQNKSNILLLKTLDFLKEKYHFSASFFSCVCHRKITENFPGKKILNYDGPFFNDSDENFLFELKDGFHAFDVIYQGRDTDQIGEGLIKECYPLALSSYNDEFYFKGIIKVIKTGGVKHLINFKKKVLIVTDVRFWRSGVGSHSRILTLYRELEKNFDVSVFFYGTIHKKDQGILSGLGIFENLFSYKKYSYASSVSFKKIDFPNPPGLKNKRHEIFLESLSNFVEAQDQYDAVIYEYIWLAYTKEAISYPTISIIDTHDLMAYREYRFSRQGAEASISISLREEIDILDNFDAVIAIQSEEAISLSGLLRDAIPICCPHPVEVPICDKNAIIDNFHKFRIGFVGGENEANEKAIKWFINEVFPVVSRNGVELNIYGGVCKRIMKYREASGVFLHGQVERLVDAYADNQVMINPMIHGGGLKIKSVESLANRKPLIASAEGAIGIANPEMSGVIVANNRAEFIDAILKILHQPNVLEKMSYDAEKAARDQFSSEACFSPLIELIEAI